MRWILSASLLMLVGCGNGLDGKWAGDLTCPGIGDRATSMNLKNDKLDNTGSLDFTFEFNGATQTQSFDAKFTQTKPSGSQKLVPALDCLGVLVSGGGQDAEEDCQGDENKVYEAHIWTWDGADSITIESPADEGCDGELTRKGGK